MNIIIKKLDKKTLTRNIIQINKITKIGNWKFKDFIINLPCKWEKSLLAYDTLKNNVAAYAIVSKKKKVLHIHLLMVSDKFKRAGVGTKLINKISNNTKSAITVKTFTHLRNTINFYLKNNFKILKFNKKTTLMIKKN
jgi:hypothetical protein